MPESTVHTNFQPNLEGRESLLSRREAMLQFLRLAGAGAGTVALGAWLSTRSEKPTSAMAAYTVRNHGVPADPQWPVMVVVQGGEPAALARRALADLGGISRFVRRGEV